MPDCDYCGESFDAEAAYLSHLGAEHADELGPIEQRRVANIADDEDSGLGVVPLALAGAVLLAVAVGGYLFLAGGDGGSDSLPQSVTQVEQEPQYDAAGDTHEHGQLSMTIMGSTVDFTQDKYQIRATGNRHFHFEGDGRWHKHTPGVTLEYAMSTLDIGVQNGEVWYDGTRYTDGENAEVSITVNGEPADPTSYVIEDGDDVVITVTEN
ncbi:hypothetical protein [Halosegnis longus]|uniref:C2H2-type domain-containing protein n=1 Tax=Halosegnis longus TaxID=2216012 RepID=A0AAJ4R9Q1_9EURY|nr:hypothetical protein Nmn1133_11000 [Salella cibi]